MPFSNELGMRVFDPREGEQYGLQVGQMFNQAMQNAQNRALRQKEMSIDQQRLDMLKQETAAKAKATQMQQLGMMELDDLVNNQNVPLRDALFKVAPKLYYGNPQALGTILHQDATEKATEAYRDALNQHRMDVLDLRMQNAATQQERDAARQQIDLLKITQGQQDKEVQRDLERERETGRNERARADRMMKATKDTTLQQIDASLRTAHQTLQDALASPKWHWLTDPEGLRKSIKDLEGERAKRLKELGIDETPSPETPKTESQAPTPPSSSPFKVGRFTITPD